MTNNTVISPVYPMLIQKYNTLIPDPNANVLDKINQIVDYLNQTGKLTNDVVNQWNQVMAWAMNDGLNTDVSNKLETMLSNGEFDTLFQKYIAPSLGDIKTLQTNDKTSAVNAINEVDQLAKTNQTNLGSLSNLTTTDKSSLVNAVNEADNLSKTNQTNIGTLSNLQTSHKTDLVSAVNDNVAQLADITQVVVNVTSYGASTTLADNHDKILAAVADVFSKGGGTIEFPAGLFKTSPISMNGYNSIKFKGVGVSKPWKTVTTIQFIASGDVGFQFADTTNPSPTWNATNCKVEGIFFDGNNQVNACINGNYDLEMKDCTFRHALQDGIRLEDMTYPVYMDKIESSYNGRHGLYVRGPMTTKFSAYRSEFDSNTGYGILLEGGASVHFQDCLTQGNSKGGVKIDWKGDSYTGNYFLQNILFTNHYWENNGTLATNDPNYEGNFALFINSPNTTTQANRKAVGIRFVGGEMHPSTNGGTYKIVSVYGLSFEYISVDHTKGSLPNPLACHLMESNLGATSADNAGNAPFPFINKYGQVDNNQAIQVFSNGGTIGMRGRTFVLTFYVPSITAGQTVNMIPSNISGIPTPSAGASWAVPNAFPLFGRTSLLGAQIYKKYSGGTRAGTLTPKFVYNYYTDGVDPTSAYTGFTVPTINNATQNQASILYNPLQNVLNGAGMFGVQLTASSDYVPGSDTQVVVYVLLEC